MAIDRRDGIQPAFAALLNVVDQVFPVEMRDVEDARTILLSSPRVSARDALHVAVTRRYDVERIFSFDRGFDAVPGMVHLG